MLIPGFEQQPWLCVKHEDFEQTLQQPEALVAVTWKPHPLPAHMYVTRWLFLLFSIVLYAHDIAVPYLSVSSEDCKNRFSCALMSSLVAHRPWMPSGTLGTC
jgi:hypothetical protein